MHLVDLTMEALRERGYDHLVTVANLETEGLRAEFAADPALNVTSACREGEGIAIASGLVAGGRRTVLCMENLGLFECLDTLRGMPTAMGIPLPIFVGYLGRGMSMEQMQEAHGGLAENTMTAYQWTEPVLSGAGIPYRVVLPTTPEDEAREALAEALDTEGPFVILVDHFFRIDDD